MHQFAVELRHTGQLRDDLSDEEVADVIWSMNAAEYWLLLVGTARVDARAVRRLAHRCLEAAASLTPQHLRVVWTAKHLPEQG